jgi:hypothetical protein
MDEHDDYDDVKDNLEQIGCLYRVGADDQWQWTESNDGPQYPEGSERAKTVRDVTPVFRFVDV